MAHGKMAKKNVDMLSEKLTSNLLKFCIPLMLTGIMQLLYNATDIVVVGRFAGKTAMAAVGSTGSLINLIINLLTGLSLGSSVLAARAFGAGDYERVNKVLHTSIVVALVGGVGVGIFGFTMSKTFLEFMGSPADIIDQSALYLKIYFAGLPFNMYYLFTSAVMRAVGDSRRPMFFLFISGMVNVLFNLFFVIVVKWGVAGVAIGTVASQIVSSLLVTRAMVKNDICPKLIFRDIKFDKSIFVQMVTIGMPSGLSGVMFALSNTIVQSAVNSFDSNIIAGNTAAANIEGFVYQAMYSFHAGAMTFVSQNIGARKYERINKILVRGILCVSVTGLVLGNTARFFGSTLLSIYNTDPEVIAAGIIRMTYICIPYFLCGVMDVFTGVLRGMGYSVLPMISSVATACAFRIIWIKTVFAAHHALPYLYSTYIISWILNIIVMLIMFLVVHDKAIAKFKREAETSANEG